MYIVRWLMGHPIIATWVLAIVAILLTYGSGGKSTLEDGTVTQQTTEQIMPADVGNKLTKQEVSAVAMPNTSLAETPAVTVTTSDVSTNESAKQAVTNSIVAIHSAEVGQAKKDVVNDMGVTSVSNDTVKSTQNAGRVTEITPKSVATSAQINNVANNSVTASMLSDTTIKNVSEDIGDLGQVSTGEMLKMAREAYWNNGLDEAAQIYRQLIKIEPDVIEHKGELGNVYWRQGYPKKAAEMYSEIAIPMINEGGTERVANMVGFIGLFYPDRAAEINKKIESSKIK